MTTGADLLAGLDKALPAGNARVRPEGRDARQQAAGLLAAIGLNELLIAQGRCWHEIVGASDGRLAKLCGRLGSSYQAEREAAYDHSVRLLQRRNRRWSDLVRLPPELAAACVRVTLPVSLLPPDQDWPATVAGLLVRAAWRSPPEHDLLQRLQLRFEAGGAVGAEEARQVRDMWWSAELDAGSLELAEP